MSGQNRPDPAREIDPDATDQLPVPDFAAAEHPHVRTDSFAAPAVPAGVAELADSLREVERRLQRKVERVAKLEGELKAAEEQLAGLQHSHAAAQTALGELREQLQLQRAAFTETQATLAQRGGEREHLQSDLVELRRRAERQFEALCTWQGFRAVSDALLDERDARIAALEREVAELRAGPTQAAGGAAPHGESAQLAELHAELVAARKLALELQQRLRQLESEAQADAALLGGVQHDIGQPADAGLRPAPEDAGAAGAVRVLIRHEGGADIVYPLGRRTTIGRTADNDIQVDTTYVSRHHAVLLSSSDHCIVEDLHSTNGVLVNGRRVGRHILHDGDTVTVGKTEFRYQQRS